MILVALDGIGRVIFLPGRDPTERSALTHGTTRTLLRDRRFVVALIATLFGAGVLALLEPTLPPLLSSRFGLHALPIGLFFGGTVLVNTLALPLVGYTTRQLGAPVTIVFGMLFAALALTMIAVSTTLVHIGIALAALGFAAPFTLVPTLELLTTLGKGNAPAEKAPYGAIYAAYNFAYAGGIFLGPLAAGFTITQFGPEAGLALPAALPMLLGLIMFAGLALSRRRRRPIPAD
jgi:predicted MFS family arabinose efflux permease